MPCPGFAFVGELRRLFRPALEQGFCTCGVPHLDCPVWSHVIDAGYTVDGVSFAEIERQQERLAPKDHVSRSTARVLFRGPPPDPRADTYLRVLATVHRRYARARGAEVLVDTSKHPAGLLLARAAGLDVACLHMVRDPRGRVHSELKRLQGFVPGRARPRDAAASPTDGRSATSFRSSCAAGYRATA